MTKIDALISKFKEVKDELNKNVNASYAGAPNEAVSADADTMKGDPMLDLVAMTEKADGPTNPHMGHSVFTMDHVHEISDMRDHGAAKKRAHEIVDASTANHANRVKIKHMIDTSKNPRHLAMGMSNHILAHPSEGLKVVKGEGRETKHDRCAREVKEKNPSISNPHAVCVAAGVEPEKWGKNMAEKISLNKNGQWSLDKVDPQENVNISHPQKPAKMVKPTYEVTNKAEVVEEQRDQNKGRSSTFGM